MPTPFSSLERRIDYHFGDPTLLQQALRHASLDLGVEDNQRLEFLGDAYYFAVQPMLARGLDSDNYCLVHLIACDRTNQTLALFSHRLYLLVSCLQPRRW